MLGKQNAQQYILCALFMKERRKNKEKWEEGKHSTSTKRKN
jgi:hypothetical protein